MAVKEENLDDVISSLIDDDADDFPKCRVMWMNTRFPSRAYPDFLKLPLKAADLRTKRWTNIRLEVIVDPKHIYLNGITIDGLHAETNP